MLASNQLQAFAAVARARNFTRAAERLHLTQSALSQRISNLESELGLTLFVRGHAGVDLTEEGLRLLRYCSVHEEMEAELLASLKGGASAASGSLGGVIRLAAYSSVLRSVVIPALAPLIRREAGIDVQLHSREMRELPDMLRRGEVDLIVLGHELHRDGIECRLLGNEEYVLVESRRKSRKDVFLDHDPDDTTTHAFFRLQNREPPSTRRSYLDDIYGILDGVAAGWGQAVVPRHLIRPARMKVVRGNKPLRMPLLLHHVRQPFHTALHHATIAALTERCPRLLNATERSSAK